ncbi:MAG: hypothetical protein ABMA64_40215, partial [Myxococcota bacterium]
MWSVWLACVRPAPPVAAPVAPLPVDVAAATAEANAAYERGDHAACAERFEAVAAATPAGTLAPYNAACCRALAGELDAAFADLQLAVDRGLRDLAATEADADLESLRADPRWPAVVAAMSAADAAYRARVNPELLQLFTDDQADRQGAQQGSIDWSVVGPRDDARLARVHELVAAGVPKAADDFYHAAMVLQHGKVPADYQAAHELAAHATELDPTLRSAWWLAAAAKDRWLQSEGQPQIYGTQYRKVDGVWT